MTDEALNAIRDVADAATLSPHVVFGMVRDARERIAALERDLAEARKEITDWKAACSFSESEGFAAAHRRGWDAAVEAAGRCYVPERQRRRNR